MIGAVSGFFPASIGGALPSAQRSAAIAQQSAVFASATQSGSLPTSQNNSSFADKLQSFFSLSPSDFSAVFSDSFSAATIFPHSASAAYNQSNLLTASRLSVTA